jgi:hypothetical protein
MRIKLSPSTGEQGTALMVTMFLCTVLFMTIAGYLLTARHQQFLGHRSQIWNMSMAVAEAGIEEGLQHLNVNSPNLEKEGWTREGTTYKRSQEISADSRYTVTIDAFDINNPSVTAVGYHDAPVLGPIGQGGVLAVAGVSVGDDSTTQNAIAKTIRRTIQVTATRNGGLFRGALIARDGVNMNGNGVRTDSFISNDPNFSNNGLYPEGIPAKLRSNGDVYVNSSLSGAADVGNADIHGHLVVGPNGVPNLGPNGGVGTYEWRALGNNGIQDGYFRDDSNFTFPDVVLPYTFGATPTAGAFTTTNVSVTSGTASSSTYPSPAPASGVVTNISYATTTIRPNPAPDGMVVNILTSSTSSKSYPAVGSYIGEVTKKGSKYYYDAITGFSYTYPILSYTYSTYTTNYSITSKNYDYILRGGDPGLSPVEYYLDQVNGSVFVTGNARLVARDGFNGEIFVNSDGKLELFAGGSSIGLSGNGVINKNGHAANCMIWCTPDVKSISFGGNVAINAVLYAPQADLKLNGGGNDIIDFIGSLVVNSATLNGHYSFHYDEALKSHNSNARYLVTSWNEI